MNPEPNFDVQRLTTKCTNPKSWRNVLRGRYNHSSFVQPSKKKPQIPCLSFYLSVLRLSFFQKKKKKLTKSHQTARQLYHICEASKEEEKNKGKRVPSLSWVSKGGFAPPSRRCFFCVPCPRRFCSRKARPRTSTPLRRENNILLFFIFKSINQCLYILHVFYFFFGILHSEPQH